MSMWTFWSKLTTLHNMQRPLQPPTKVLRQQQSLSGMNSSQFMVFPKRLLTDQGWNFESQLIKELCKLANIWKVQTTPYHPEMNGQCDRFIQMLISMIGTLETKNRQHEKDYLPTLVHAYDCTKNHATDFSPYYLMYRQKPRLLTDIRFGLASPQAEKHSHNKFLAKVSAQLRWCYELANLHQCKESTHHKCIYDHKMRASKLEPGDLCLVRQRVFGGKCKISDHWENTKYEVIEWQPNLPVYTIKPTAGGRTKSDSPQKLTYAHSTSPQTEWNRVQIKWFRIQYMGWM